ncbi:MAG: histidine--tRNA ligase [candidate division WOR-3 bacterium]
MEKKYQRIRGTRDIYGEEFDKFIFIFEKSKKVCELYGYNFIITPTFEVKELFEKSTGETTDIVEKEMYVFEDLKGRKLALRPEGTPPVLRAIVEENIELPSKFSYFLNMFRYEKPQKGRYREFYQLGAEAVGYKEPYIDLEILILAEDILKEINIKDYVFEINSVGCLEDRKKYSEYLKEELKEKIKNFCSNCQQRYERNPFRILDCKIDREKIKFLKPLKKFLCNECLNHHEKLLNLLLKENFNFIENPFIVRGLDYYTKTAFEIISKKLGAQDALGGGGRYDYLMKIIGGIDTPGIGFAFGVERLMIAMENYEKKEKNLIYVIYVSEKEKEEAIKWVRKLREKGIYSDMEWDTKSLKSQLRKADKKKAKWVLIIGEEELRKNTYRLKNMIKGEEILSQNPFEILEKEINSTYLQKNN